MVGGIWLELSTGEHQWKPVQMLRGGSTVFTQARRSLMSRALTWRFGDGGLPTLQFGSVPRPAWVQRSWIASRSWVKWMARIYVLVVRGLSTQVMAGRPALAR